VNPNWEEFWKAQCPHIEWNVGGEEYVENMNPCYGRVLASDNRRFAYWREFPKVDVVCVGRSEIVTSIVIGMVLASIYGRIEVGNG
jgi:hypothetical protein